MELRVLGPIEVLINGTPLHLGKRQHRLILGVLGIEANRPVSGNRLIDLLWADQPPRRPRAVLHSRISELRAALTMASSGERQEALLTDGDGYVLRIAPTRVDVQVFRNLIRESRQTQSDARLCELLRQALSLWRGPALGGWLPGQSHDALCRGLESARLTAAENLFEAELRLGRHSSIVDELLELSVANPARDRLTVALMLALHRAGRTSEAIDIYHDRRAWLDTELGVDPGHDLQQLHVALLRDDPAIRVTSVLDATATVEAGTTPPLVEPRQLPPVVRYFVGRAAELAALTRLAEGLPRSSDVAVIVTIDGTAGIGKTTLAVHWARSVANLFPDGQLYINLRGFDRTRSPMDPAEGVRAVLDALAVPAHLIPAGLTAQVGLYRSLLAGRRLLVLLDNARDAEQVRPLLPTAPGCLALVTSRNRLTSLVAAEAAHPFTLGLLSPRDAQQLLARRPGGQRLLTEPAAADEIIARCAGLPRALAIVAARAATHPALPLSTLAQQLRHARARLDALSTGDPASDLRAVFSWSYDALGPATARLLRLLGLHPGPDISVAAAASLAGLAEPRARRLLAELVDANLINENASGRYTMHDLLRVYAAEQAEIIDTERQRSAAIHRVLDHYLHSAYAAVRLLNQHLEPVELAPAHPGAVPEGIADRGQALTWFTTEHDVLLTTVDYAAEAGWYTYTWQLAWAMVPYLERRARWREQCTTQRAALAAAEKLANSAARARSHYYLARAATRLGQLDDAHRHLYRALRLHGRRGDHQVRASIYDALAEVWARRARWAKAIHYATRGLDLARAAGHRVGRARALNTVGWLHAQAGNHQEALAACGQALALFHQLGDHPDQAATWDSLGYTHHHVGDHHRAVTCYLHAVDFYRGLGDRFGEYVALDCLGDTHHSAGDLDAAREAWQQCVSILNDLNDPYAEQVHAKLAGLATANRR